MCVCAGDNLNDDVPDFWNKDKGTEDYRLPVKIKFEGLEQPIIFLMRRNMKLEELSKKLGTSCADGYRIWGGNTWLMPSCRRTHLRQTNGTPLH
jgi:hypothetical protein